MPRRHPTPISVAGSTRKLHLGAHRLTLLLSVAVVVAAVVVLVLTGSRPAGPKAAPTPTHPTPTADGRLPAGAAPKVPYLVGQGLYVDGRAQPGNWDMLATAGDSAVGYTSLPQDGTAAVLRDGHVVLTVTSVPWPSVVLSPDGSKVAWVELVENGTVGRLVLHDLRTGRDLGTLPVDAKLVTVDSDAQVRAVRVDNDGTVLYGDLGTWHAWRPGMPVGAAMPAEHTALHPGLPVGANPLSMSPDESLGAWLTARDGTPLPSDGMGERHDGVTVQQPGRRGTRFTIALPVGTNATGLAWESATDLLVTITDTRLNSPLTYLRCSTTTRLCEQAPTVLDR